MDDDDDEDEDEDNDDVDDQKKMGRKAGMEEGEKGEEEKQVEEAGDKLEGDTKRLT